MEQKDALKPIKPANPLFKKALDYKTYRLNNRSASYTPTMAGNLWPNTSGMEKTVWA